MREATYLRKHQQTKITADMTVAEARTARKVRTELARFWKDAALTHLRNQGVQVGAPHWVYPVIMTNTRPAGVVTVEIRTAHDMGRGGDLISVHRINKKELLA